ncbi:MAG: UvrD-helicase domain-containing protein [archaeon]|nr:UvrD-helicase domain-containing protein [archaeon]
MSLNDSQRKIAETIEGMIVVDAGPGTGKTHTVTARCINILRRNDYKGKDLTMLTFTRNAANEMRERVKRTVEEKHDGNDPDDPIDDRTYRILDEKIKQMTIGTFDSFCFSVVKQCPSSISRFFGFDEILTNNATITENMSVNLSYFRRFLDGFLLDHGDEYGDDAAVAADNPDDLYNLLNVLMSRAVLPLKGKNAWFGYNYEKDLTGDIEKTREYMGSCTDYKKMLKDDFGDDPEVGGLTVEVFMENYLSKAAEEDRTRMFTMVHDIYYEYLRACVSDDHLTFGIVACLAFVALYSDDDARERLGCRNLIVDEFQDTNSAQLMISLMLLKEPNLCVVGDWKQGIYGFRFVSIENITDFERRVVEFRRFLNEDRKRIPFFIPETVNLPLDKNYRSSNLVIEKAFEALTIRGTDGEGLDVAEVESKITHIVGSNPELDEHTGFEHCRCDDKRSEVEEVLRSIEKYVNDEEYAIVDRNGPRKPEYRDIAVLCRDSGMCRNIWKECNEHCIPAFIQGDVEIMRSREGKLLLAWLRLLSNDGDKWGSVPILADMGYSANEIKALKKLPDVILEQKKNLRSRKRRVTDLISEIFHFYGLDNDITQAIISELSSSHRSSLLTISDMVSIIESDMLNRTKYDVDGIPDTNAVIIQTLHKSKGLEYPIVIIPGVDQNVLPSFKTNNDTYSFNETAGIRCKQTVIHFEGEMKLGKSWRTYAVSKAIPKDYSEERRLLFVGITRAKQYVKLIAGKIPSKFFLHYEDGNEIYAEDTEVPVHERTDRVLISKPDIPVMEARRRNVGVHDILSFGRGGMEPDFDYEDRDGTGRGMAFGTAVHRVAELMVGGYSPSDEELRDYGPQIDRIQQVLDGLGDVKKVSTEIECSLPVNEYNVTLRGIIDMLAEYPDKVVVHDWKTDRQFDFREEYMVQLSVYAHVLEKVFEGRKVLCELNWISMKEDLPGHPRDEVFEPLPMGEIEDRLRMYLGL